MIAQPTAASESQQCFGGKVRRPKHLLFRRSFSLNHIANVKVDFFFANDSASDLTCQSATESSTFFGNGCPPRWSPTSRIAEEPEDTGDDDDALTEMMVSGSDAAESLAADLLERHVNNFFQWVVIPAAVFVCLVYAFINAPAPAKGQLYRSMAATFCLLVGFAVQSCIVALWSPDGS